MLTVAIIGFTITASMIAFNDRKYRDYARKKLPDNLNNKGIAVIKYSHGTETASFQSLGYGKIKSNIEWYARLDGLIPMTLYQEAEGEKQIVLTWKSKLQIPGLLYIYRQCSMSSESRESEHSSLNRYHKTKFHVFIRQLLRKYEGNDFPKPPVTEGIEVFGDSDTLAKHLLYTTNIVREFMRANSGSRLFHLRYVDGTIYLITDAGSISDLTGALIFLAIARKLENAINEEIDASTKVSPLTISELANLLGAPYMGLLKVDSQSISGPPCAVRSTDEIIILKIVFIIVTVFYIIVALARWKGHDPFTLGNGLFSFAYAAFLVWLMAIIRNNYTKVSYGLYRWTELTDKESQSDSDGTAYYGIFSYFVNNKEYKIKNAISRLAYDGEAPIWPLRVVFLPNKPQKAKATLNQFFVPFDINDVTRP